MGFLDQVVGSDVMDELERRFTSSLLRVLYDPYTRRSFLANVAVPDQVRRDPRCFYDDDVSDADWTLLFTMPLEERKGFVLRNIGGGDIMLAEGDEAGPADVNRYDLLVPGAVEDYAFGPDVLVWILAETAAIQAVSGYEYR